MGKFPFTLRPAANLSRVLCIPPQVLTETLAKLKPASVSVSLASVDISATVANPDFGACRRSQPVIRVVYVSTTRCASKLVNIFLLAY